MKLPSGYPLIEVIRGDLVESVHAVAACAMRADGRELLALGDVETPIFLRSSAKPFIAAAVVRAGVADALGLEPHELAVIAASHEGEDGHAEAVRSIFRKAGIDEDALRCGIQADHRPAAVYNNCSGKHAGILALAKHLGAPLDTYLDATNPAEREILALCERVIGEPLGPERLGIDGCGIPVFATSLRRAAIAFARFATLEGADPDTQALRRVREAMVTHPWYVAGTNRFDTALMQATRGRIACKAGAEGVHATAVQGEGVGMVLKVIDGNRRAASPAAIHLLGELALLDDREKDELAAFARPIVRNHAGTVVGSIAPAPFRLSPLV